MEIAVIAITFVGGFLVVKNARKGTEPDSVTNSDFSDEQSEEYLDYLSARRGGETYFDEEATRQDKTAFSLRGTESLNALQTPSAAFMNTGATAHNPNHRLLEEVDEEGKNKQGKRRLRFKDEVGEELLMDMSQIPKLAQKSDKGRPSAYDRKSRKSGK